MLIQPMETQRLIIRQFELQDWEDEYFYAILDEEWIRNNT